PRRLHLRTAGQRRLVARGRRPAAGGAGGGDGDGGVHRPVPDRHRARRRTYAARGPARLVHCARHRRTRARCRGAMSPGDAPLLAGFAPADPAWRACQPRLALEDKVGDRTVRSAPVSGTLEIAPGGDGPGAAAFSTGVAARLRQVAHQAAVGHRMAGARALVAEDAVAADGEGAHDVAAVVEVDAEVAVARLGDGESGGEGDRKSEGDGESGAHDAVLLE